MAPSSRTRALLLAAVLSVLLLWCAVAFKIGPFRPTQAVSDRDAGAALYVVDAAQERYPSLADHTRRSAGTLRVATSLAAAGEVPAVVDWSLVHAASPRVFHLRNVLPPRQCDELVSLARTQLAPGEAIAAQATDACPNIGLVHTAHSLSQHVAAVASALLGLPASHVEPVQLLHYRPGQSYRPHPDAFSAAAVVDAPPGTTADEKEALRRRALAAQAAHGGERVATVTVRLNHVRGGGGETRFPRAEPVPYAVADAGAGDVVVFYDMAADGGVDPSAWHEGVAPKGGDKWLAVTWVRQHPFVPATLPPGL